MSRTSVAVREKRLRHRRNADNQTNRQQLVAILKDPKTSLDDKQDAMVALQKRRIDESPSRSRNRCSACNRSRGVIRYFGLCRLCLVQFASKGWLPGVHKYS